MSASLPARQPASPLSLNYHCRPCYTALSILRTVLLFLSRDDYGLGTKHVRPSFVAVIDYHQQPTPAHRVRDRRDRLRRPAGPGIDHDSLPLGR